MMRNSGDFSQGSILRHLFRLALPILAAEIVHVLYKVVFPLISFINAFASLCGSGGAPLCSISRGEGRTEDVRKIMETAFMMLLFLGVTIGLLLYFTMEWTLPLMGADTGIRTFAEDYFSVYLAGTVFVMIGLGLNPFINMLGFSVVGMVTVLLGAVLNIVLDPLFIFVFKMGVCGAAFASVISQFCSVFRVSAFLFSRKSPVRLGKLHFEWPVALEIMRLGCTGFMFKMTNSATQAVANMALRLYGGVSSSLYIGPMSIINSIREVLSLPVSSFTTSGQPIEGFNYGARRYSRVVSSIRIVTLVYNFFAWRLLRLFPGMFISIFTPDSLLMETTLPCLRRYFTVFFMMNFQSAGQSTFVALNCPKRALFFSLFRKVVLVIPLTLLLPLTSLGVQGVFTAGMVSQLIGASFCYACMRLSVYRKMKRTPDGESVVA